MLSRTMELRDRSDLSKSLLKAHMPGHCCRVLVVPRSWLLQWPIGGPCHTRFTAPKIAATGNIWLEGSNIWHHLASGLVISHSVGVPGSVCACCSLGINNSAQK